MREGGPTPSYDELFDAARKLGTAELRLELRSADLGSELWLQVVRCEGGDVLHERPAIDGVEAAAAQICEELRRGAER